MASLPAVALCHSILSTAILRPLVRRQVARWKAQQDAANPPPTVYHAIIPKHRRVCVQASWQPFDPHFLGWQQLIPLGVIDVIAASLAGRGLSKVPGFTLSSSEELPTSH